MSLHDVHVCFSQQPEQQRQLQAYCCAQFGASVIQRRGASVVTKHDNGAVAVPDTTLRASELRETSSELRLVYGESGREVSDK